MNKTKSPTEIEVEIGSNVQRFHYRVQKKNHDADAARQNSKITPSLNDYADLVSKRILLNILGASSNNEYYGFVAPLPRIAAICSWNFVPNST